MDENKQILLPSKKYYKADDEDVSIRMGLENTESLVRVGDRDIVLDIAEQFNTERQVSTKFKIYGKMRMVFRNMYSGSTTYTNLQRNLYLNGDGSEDIGQYPNKWKEGYMSYEEFAFLRNDVLRQSFTPQTGDTLSSFTTETELMGNSYTGHTLLTPITAPYQNWNIYLSYVYEQDSTFPMRYSFSGTTTGCGDGTTFCFKSSDGIPFRITDDGKYYTLTSPVEHGFSVGEYVLLSGGTCNYTGTTATNSLFQINAVGNQTFNSDKYSIQISKAQFKSTATINGQIFALGKRVLDKKDISGSTSIYYVHKHKTLTEEKDYILDYVGFEKPIWEEERKLLFENVDGTSDYLVTQNRMEAVLYDFKDTLDISGLTNNMGFTPTEVYVTTILRNGNGYFDYPPKVGYKFNFHDTWIDQHFSGTTSYEKSMTGNTQTFSPNSAVSGFPSFTGGTKLDKGTILTGAYVEYNPKEHKERIVSESFHKFTIKKTVFNHSQDQSVVGFSGATSANPFGVYYQPHHRIKLKQLSPYIEIANTNDIYNLPENCTYDEHDGVWRWRDVYDHGYVDPDGNGTNFPFVNGQHYVMNEINFYLRNEKYYTNKKDGIIDFNDIINNKNKNVTNC